jgi:proteasome accessory factor C
VLADEHWLRRLLLRLAPHAEVVAPREVAESFTAAVREAHSLYT